MNIHVTRNLGELDRLTRSWRREDETVCFFGGDGSIACGLTSLIRNQGEHFNLPPVLAVRAGTINMLCSVLGFRENPARTLERWHRNDRSGALRAAVFGISDGLVSNAALVMGFAGSGVQRSTVVLAGLAGLLAGSFSMAAGEYISMSSQREMFERELSLEAQELAENPAEERDELALLYQAKGLSPEEAGQLADRLISDKEAALDTLAREELGLDPEALGSPWTAAFSSLFTFAIGAAVALVPYLVAAGTAALVAAIVAVAVALFAVGAGTGVLNGRSAVRSGLRQLLVGGLAAAVTYGVGAALGAGVS